MNKTVGVIHGGISHEREKSLQYGKYVTRILKELGMDILELHLHPNGSWTVDGKVENLEHSLKKVDNAWNCLVGSDGESALLENLCQKCGTKLVGHNMLHTDLSSDKNNLKLVLQQHKIKSPYGKVILKQNYSKEDLKSVFAFVGIPAIVKPLKGSGMWGIFFVNNFAEFENAVEFLISENQDVLVEKVIKGVPVSCFVFEHHNLLHTNIKVHDHEGDSVKVSREDIMNIRNDALYIHNSLAYTHHVEYDFILAEKNGKKELYFIEANTHPSLSHGYIKDVFRTGAVKLKEYIASKIS
jgi:D-alanine-D-alanine ligase